MSVFPQEKIREVLRHLDPSKLLHLINYHTDKIQDEGEKIRCFCPVHKEIVFRTLIIEKEKKTYRCSYNLCPGNKGGDLIDLYARFKDISYEDALIELVEQLNLPVQLPPTEEFIAKEIEVGENLVTMGQFDEAYEQFLKVIRFQPDNVNALKGMVEVVLQARPDEAADWLDKLVRLLNEQQNWEELTAYAEQLLARREDVEIRAMLAEAYENQGFLERAYNECLALADLYEAQQEYDKALALYRKVQQSDIDLFDVNALIIQLLIAIGKSAEAAEEAFQQARAKREHGKLIECEQLLEQALELDPSRHDVRSEFISLICELGIPSDRIERCSELIDQIIEAGQLDEAARTVEQLLARQPEQPTFLEKKLRVLRRQNRHEEANRIQLQLADIYLDSELPDLALTVLDELLQFDPQSIEALGRKAAIHRLNDDPDQAAATYLEVIAILKEQGQLEQALGIYEILREIKPDDLAVRQDHIHLLKDAGRAEEAFTQAVAICDDYVALGDYEQAIHWLTFALTLRADLVEYQIKLAELYLKNEQPEEAEAQYFRIFEALRQKGELDECIGILQRVLTLNPASEKAIIQLAACYIDQGETQKGISRLWELVKTYKSRGELDGLQQTLEKILQYQPGDAAALEELAAVHSARGDTDRAHQTLLRLADVHAAARQFSDALAVVEKILGPSPQNIAAHQKKIELLEAAGRPAEVIQARFALAGIFHDLAEVEGEKEQYLAIIESDPEREAARKQLIRLLLDQGDRAAALAQTDELVQLYRTNECLPDAEQFIRELLGADNEWMEMRERLTALLRETGQTQALAATILETISILEGRHDLEGAVDQFYALLEIEPREPAHRIRLIETLLKLGWQAKAMAEYDQLADVFIALSRLDDALQVLTEIKKNQPANHDVRRRIVALHLDRRDIEAAVDETFDLAALFSREAKPDRAIEVLREALAHAPKNQRVLQKLIELYEETGRTDEALATYHRLFGVHLDNGDLQAAVTTQKAAIALSPKDPELRRTLIGVLESHGRTDEAVEEKFALANILHECNQTDEAIRTLDEILNADERNIKARRLKADIYKKTGQNLQALEELSAIAALLDDEGFIQHTRARIQIASAPILNDYNFETFVVGQRNTFAYATAMAIAKEPAKHYNPLFLYSDVGLGKTHLLHAIANFFKQHNPNIVCLYTNAEEFTSSLIEAIQNNTVPELRARYREIGCLLIDDIQFLAGKERAQEEFFHIFNALYEANKQIVITSDRPPKDIKHLERRLKSRFGAGIIVDIQPPDLETRIAILKRELELHHNGISVPFDCIELMAETIETNIRQLKGALNQLIATHRFTGQPITLDFTRQVLNSFTQKI
ncbi:MAG: hypothetical protein Kow0059_21030 [Candidatus Sumerlaeia bacterium]